MWLAGFGSKRFSFAAMDNGVDSTYTLCYPALAFFTFLCHLFSTIFHFPTIVLAATRILGQPFLSLFTNCELGWFLNQAAPMWAHNGFSSPCSRSAVLQQTKRHEGVRPANILRSRFNYPVRRDTPKHQEARFGVWPTIRGAGIRNTHRKYTPLRKRCRNP
ncbi:uncharacterized protein EI90DRAFT_3029361 [Cantharellus anzutake]|uniref:uncharacterized protein n=1 Tax=Cantharellus anzutake TaxID=1750568 RepID=UPI001906F790|nr:uncharacterized protein EI90DRAFT_3029361 [Cantharellus anzutake]KAF8344350.1 hypothetical protein EI90DRAFT_3029361 [Cantharellus anzutake]